MNQRFSSLNIYCYFYIHFMKFLTFEGFQKRLYFTPTRYLVEEGWEDGPMS